MLLSVGGPSIYDVLSIVGKRIHLGTPPKYSIYTVKEAIPSIEKKGGRYKVVSEETGKTIEILIGDMNLRKVM